MTDISLQKLVSTCLKLGERTFASPADPAINEALTKFTTLNNQYKIEHQVCHLLRLDEDGQEARKRIGKIDNFTILAQLRHLENKASISNAQHQKYERDKVKRDTANKGHVRTKKNWKKIESCLKEPYLVVYNNLTQKKQQEIFDESLIPDVESEEEKSTPEEQQAKKMLNFSRQLKSYKKIIQFTKEKIKRKSEFESRSPISERKAQSLDQLRSAHKNRPFYKDYVETAKKFEIAKQKNKIKVEGFSSAQQVVNRKLSRIFKKTVTKHNLQQYKDHEHLAGLMKKQSEIIKNSPNIHHKHENFKKIKGKFAEIVVEMGRGVNKRKRTDHRFSHSLEIKRNQSQSKND